jgi:DNA-binding CsgD family transcriptional regulator/tetratricopeptide (TPR) repeat protein
LRKNPSPNILTPVIRSPLVCPTSIGRDEPLQSLIERLDSAISGSGSVVLIGGNAGIGKSRLIRDLKHHVATRQIRMIEGRCTSTESSVPYAPLMNALRFRIEKGEGEAVAQILGPLRAVLAPIFPQLEVNQGGTAEGDADREKERPFELIFAVLERLAADEPMLLVLEDVHWADQTSLELLHHLAHRAESLRMLIIATYRSDELHAAHPLRRLLGALARDRVGKEMRLHPLTRDETTEMLECMLDTVPDPAFASAIWRRSEGNPFFVEELISVLAGGGALEPNEEAAMILERAPLPSTVSEAVLERVNALGPKATETLSAAAVIGRSFDFEDLRSVLGLSELELLEVLEQLVAHQLLREDRLERKDSYSFPHALMQEAMYESLISRRRRVLHRRVALSLETRMSRTPSRLDELAFHFRIGGDHERAWHYSKLAGDEAVRLRAWDDAAAHYENALASLEEMSDETERAADLLERLAGVAWRRSRAAEGRQYTEEALRLRRGLGHNEETARVLRRIASICIEEGDTEGAAEALDEALGLLGKTSDSSQLGAIYDDLGKLSLARGELDRAESLLMHGLSLASKDAQSAEEVPALVSLGELSILGGDVSAGVSRLDLALALLKEGRLPFERLMRVYSEGVRVLILAQEYARALAWADAAIALCRRQSVVGLDALFRAMRAAILTITSGEEDTLAQAQSAVDELRRTQRAELRDALRILGYIHRVRGDLVEARRAYEESSTLGERGRPVGIALVALAEGKNTEAAEILEAALQAVPPSQPLVAIQLLPYAIESLIAVGRVSDAEKYVESIPLLPEASASDAQLHHARGLLRLAQHRSHEAREELSAAADAWSSKGNRLEARRARVALLEAVLSSGDSSEGLALGRSLLEELGRPLLSREREVVRRILRRAGVRTRPSVPAARESHEDKSVLTTREQEVLMEVAQGRTNREIAQALGIAEKTVSVHVSHVLAKLGCKTRTQAARYALQ